MPVVELERIVHGRWSSARIPLQNQSRLGQEIWRDGTKCGETVLVATHVRVCCKHSICILHAQYMYVSKSDFFLTSHT